MSLSVRMYWCAIYMSLVINWQQLPVSAFMTFHPSILPCWYTSRPSTCSFQLPYLLQSLLLSAPCSIPPLFIPANPFPILTHDLHPAVIHVGRNDCGCHCCHRQEKNPHQSYPSTSTHIPCWQPLPWRRSQVCVYMCMCASCSQRWPSLNQVHPNIVLCEFKSRGQYSLHWEHM